MLFRQLFEQETWTYTYLIADPEAKEAALVDPVLETVERDFMVIGEAARNMPAEIQTPYPTIPWRVMGDMRNIVTHEYFQIDIATLWETIQQDLPSLIPQLQTLLNAETQH